MPSIPDVSLTVTFDEWWFPYCCGSCGHEFPDGEPITYDHAGRTCCPVCDDVAVPDTVPDPAERRGFLWAALVPTSVLDNPWGAFESDVPFDVTVTALEAAEAVLNFPGGVWNYSEGEAEQDIRTGHCRSVTLHVENEHEALVFALADVLALYLT